MFAWGSLDGTVAMTVAQIMLRGGKDDNSGGRFRSVFVPREMRRGVIVANGVGIANPRVGLPRFVAILGFG